MGSPPLFNAKTIIGEKASLIWYFYYSAAAK